MTDYGFLLALGIAFCFAVDPLDWRLERIALTKHLPLLLAVPSVLLTLVAARLFPTARLYPNSIICVRPLLVLSAFIVGGSLYARIYLDIQNTFLFAGVYMWFVPMAAFMLIHTAAPKRMLRIYLSFFLIAGTVIFTGLAVNYGVRQVYHELEYLVPPVAVFFAFHAGGKWVKRVGVVFFLIAAILFKKNTGYLAAILVLAYLMFFLIWPVWSKQDAFRKMQKVFSLIYGLMAVAVFTIFLLIHRETYLPTGNTEFRTLTYERAWGRFLDSPFWGRAFTEAGTEEFSGFDTGVANNVLPTHSDILDILANGGLLSFVLWLWGLARVAKLAYSMILRPSNRTHPYAPYGHMLACMSLVGILTYAFNPIILQPAKSMLLWTNLGFLVGISLLAKAESLKRND